PRPRDPAPEPGPALGRAPDQAPEEAQAPDQGHDQLPREQADPRPRRVAHARAARYGCADGGGGVCTGGAGITFSTERRSSRERIRLESLAMPASASPNTSLPCGSSHTTLRSLSVEMKPRNRFLSKYSGAVRS